MTESLTSIATKNDTQWNAYYATYQGDDLVPGTKYPNEHLVRFLQHWRKLDGLGASRRIIIELGFGTITNLVMMHDLGFKVRGYEVSVEAVRRGKLALKNKGIADAVPLGLYTNGEIPLPDGSVDVIVGLQCVYYNLDQERFAQECARVLKPGGLIFLSFFSPAHEYMRHIDGKPGSIVTFAADHPNPRLAGLRLFLYRDREQLADTYGQWFKTTVGLDEYNIVPLHQAWYYLCGQRTGQHSEPNLEYPTSIPATKQARHPVKSSVDLDAALRDNVAIWDGWHASLADGKPFGGSRYPSEYITRFLAARDRILGAGYFSHYQGREEQRTRGLRALEINPENPANLLMAAQFGYRATGVSWSNEARVRAMRVLALPEFTGAFAVAAWDGKALPFDDESQDVLFSYKAAYYQPDQQRFAAECARVATMAGTIFFCYLASDHSYLNFAEPLGAGLYRFVEGHPNPRLVGTTVFVGEPSDLERIWSPHFRIAMKFFRYDNHPSYSSFNVVIGVRRR